MSRPRVLIAGGGFAALECVLELAHAAPDLLDVTVLAPQEHFELRPAGVRTPFDGLPPERVGLRDVLGPAGAALTLGTLAGVEPELGVARTADGDLLRFDELVVAVGARAVTALPGALPLRGAVDAAAVGALAARVRPPRARSLAVVVPPGAHWPLPAYEVALALSVGAAHGAVRLVTPETRPLEAFGPTPAAAVERLLAGHGVELLGGAVAASWDGRRLRMADGRLMDCESCVALGSLVGPGIPGLPADLGGFLPVDAFGRVAGTAVHAAGDATDVSFKQGGVGAQAGAVVARGIARRAGADVAARPLVPVLHGLLLDGRGGRLFLRRDVAERDGEVAQEPLWWPPAKVHARRLSPVLAGLLADAPARLSPAGPPP
jgi:hypothetical protein